MTAAQQDGIAQAYDELFGNIDEVFNYCIAYEPKFVSLLEEAIQTKTALTREAVEKVLGPIPWEE